MGAAEDLFAGVRPSDLRYDNVHILAEYIARAQRFSDSATQIEKSAERLVQGAVRTTEEGVKQFQATVKRMQAEFRCLEGLLQRALETAGNEIAKAVAESHTSGAIRIREAGEVTRQHTAELASRAAAVNQAAARLEQSAALAETNRQRCHEDLEKLQTFKRELVQFESESQASIAAAKANLYRGVGLLQRVVYVFSPPVPVVRDPKAPSRPPMTAGKSKTPNVPTNAPGRSGGTGAAPTVVNKLPRK